MQQAISEIGSLLWEAAHVLDKGGCKRLHKMGIIHFRWCICQVEVGNLPRKLPSQVGKKCFVEQYCFFIADRTRQACLSCTGSGVASHNYKCGIRHVYPSFQHSVTWCLT